MVFDPDLQDLQSASLHVTDIKFGPNDGDQRRKILKELIQRACWNHAIPKTTEIEDNNSSSGASQTQYPSLTYPRISRLRMDMSDITV